MIEFILALTQTCAFTPCIVNEKSEPPSITICDRNIADNDTSPPNYGLKNQEGVLVLVVKRAPCHNI